MLLIQRIALFVIICSCNVDSFPLFFGRFLFPSIFCGVFNEVLWSIFVEGRLFVLARYHVYLGDFFGLVWPCYSAVIACSVFLRFFMLYAFTSRSFSLASTLLGFIVGPSFSITLVLYNAYCFSFFPEEFLSYSPVWGF